MLEAGKIAMEFLPNIEVVSLFLMLFATWFGAKAFWAAIVFVLVECLRYSFGIWTVMYIYIWPLLVVLALLFRKRRSAVTYAVISGAFGLCFGAFCSIPYIVTSGMKVAVLWWINGIPWDITHCVANVVLMLVLYEPLNRAMSVIKKRYHMA